MARISVSVDQLGALTGFLRRVGAFLRRVALAGALGAAAVLAHYFDDEVTPGDVVLVVVLLAPAAVVLLFAQGLREVAALPERLRRIPGEGQERLAELTRLAGEARSTRTRGLPLLLWRLRGSVGSVRDLAGIAFPLRVFTPWFLGLAAIATLLCLVLAGAGVIALVLLL